MAAPVGPVPVVGGDLTAIRGVGPYVSGRITANYGLADTQQLANFVNALPNRWATQNFVDDVTRNARSCECLEGYVVRRHNRAAREGLVDWMVAVVNLPAHKRPSYTAPHSTRKPPGPGQPALVPGQDGRRFYKRVVQRVGVVGAKEGGWAFPYARPAARALATNPATAGGIAGYPYGRHDYSGSALAGAATRAARDAILRNPAGGNAAYNRRYWPCPCFRERATCKDFNPGRGNRGAGVTPCGWIGGQCQAVAAPPPAPRVVHPPAGRLRSGRRRGGRLRRLAGGGILLVDDVEDEEED